MTPDHRAGYAEMDWEDLRYFLALAECGTLSGAARRMNVTHSTVSRRIARLEEGAAAPLFDRSPEGFILTAAGETVFENARDMGRRASAIRDAMTLVRLGGVVRISATDTVAEEIVCDGLAEFHRTHPDIRLTIVPTNRNADLLHHEADIALRLARPQTGEMTIRRLGTLEYGFYVALGSDPDGPVAGYTEALQDLPESRWLAETWPNAPVLFRSDSVRCLLRALEAGIGAGVLPRVVARRSRLLVEVPVTPAPPGRDIWAVTRVGATKSPRIRAVLDHIAGRFGESG